MLPRVAGKQSAGRNRQNVENTWITAADLMAGATLPVRVRLHVTLHADSPRPGGSNILAVQLRRHSSKLLGWAKGDPKRARQLLLDPIGAAAAAGAKLSTADLAVLDKHARAAELTSVLPAGVELVGLEVETSTSKRPGLFVAPPRPPAAPAQVKAKAKAKRGGKRK